MSTDRLTLAKPPRSKPAVRKAPFDFARAIAAVFILGVTACILAPIVNLARIALSGGGAFWGGFAANVLPNALVQTSLLLFGVAALAALIGIASAWLVTVYRFPLRGALVWLLPLPLAIPTYIAAYVYVDLFATIAPAPDIRSLGGAVFIFGLVLYPYVYIAARAMFQTQSACLIEVARTLGASRFGLVRHIAVPLARPALAVGLSLVLLETLNDIGASEYLGVPTLTLSVFTTWLNRGDLPGAAQLSMVMLVFAAVCVAIEQAARRNRRFGISIQRPRIVSPIVLRGGARFAAALACFVPVVLGFVIPILYLAHQVIVRGLLVGFDPALIRHTLTTVSLAAIATIVALAIGAGLALAVRAIQKRFFTNCLIVAGLGYAIPGTVLALALLGPLVSMDEGINVVWRGLTGVTLGLVIAGSGAAIVIAYVIRFLTISIGSAHAGLTRVSTHIDDVARTLGAHVGEVTWRIHLPLLRPAIGGAALLIFVDCLKELPATLLLRPLNVETLSTYIYQFATRGTFEEGALAALLIVAVGVLPVIWMTRYAEVQPAS